jgi:hypothetical protein
VEVRIATGPVNGAERGNLITTHDALADRIVCCEFVICRDGRASAQIGSAVAHALHRAQPGEQGAGYGGHVSI